MNRYYKIIHTLLTIAILLSVNGCAELVDVDAPKTQTIFQTVFSDDQTATSVVAGIYSTMITNGSFAGGGPASMTIQAGLSSDEYTNMNTSASSLQFSDNSLAPANATVLTMWADLYRYIYYANSALEGIHATSSLSPEVSKQLEGEALFIRAFSHFYLVALFDKVPIVTSTDYKTNSAITRSEVKDVFDQILSDLTKAEQLMRDDYSHAQGERIRPNKWTAMAMSARVHLFLGNWNEALVKAEEVIAQSNIYQLESDMSNVFLNSSTEAIWQLKPNQPESNSNEAQTFMSLSFASLSPALINSFETDDLRLSEWTHEIPFGDVTYTIPYKYKIGYGEPLTEYSMVIRLAEIILIHAEASAMLNQLPQAQDDINILRTRAGLQALAISGQQPIIKAIQQERRSELFSEWGHRWLDLKRTGQADHVLSLVKPDWQTTDQYYPVPKTERDNNPNLTQNAGY